jgi:hypothetical protein
MLEAETGKLDPHDGRSVAKLVKDLEDRGAVVLSKPVDGKVPLGSGLNASTFCLIVQTRWQAERLREFGSNSIWFMDATHNTTQYENMLLTTIMVRDRHKHGEHLS